MEIYLIRHTAVAIEKAVCYGHTDVELASSFASDFETIRKRVDSVDAIYSSPLKRCLNLAVHLAGSVPLYKDDRLKELNFGEWEGKKWNEIQQEELHHWMKDFVNCSCPGGESYLDLFSRCNSFWNELILANHDRVLVVCHAGVIRSILSFLLNIPLERSFALQIDYGKISKIKFIDNGNYLIEYVNK